MFLRHTYGAALNHFARTLFGQSAMEPRRISVFSYWIFFVRHGGAIIQLAGSKQFREAKPKRRKSVFKVMRAFPERLAKLLYVFPKDR